MPDTNSIKSTLRKALRIRRRALGPAQHRQLSELAAAAIARLPALRPAARIAVYLPFDGEASPAALVAGARHRRVRLYVPVVDSVRHRRLRFLPLTGRTRRGTFGIEVPDHAAPCRALSPRWFDLIVVPLVGFDAHGRRLGMGGGFYDRALAFRRVRGHWRGPRLVGLAFECQRADSVFAQAHDVRLDALATERGVRHFLKAPPDEKDQKR